jgi:hypothetical protein
MMSQRVLSLTVTFVWPLLALRLLAAERRKQAKD